MGGYYTPGLECSSLIGSEMGVKRKEVAIPLEKEKGSVKARVNLSGIFYMAELLSATEIKEWLKKVPEWEQDKKTVERTFEFDDFFQAIDFVDAVAEIAEEQEHHPDIDIRYNKVRIVLSTHSEGGLTDLDFETAEKIDTLSE